MSRAEMAQKDTHGLWRTASGARTRKKLRPTTVS
jgi:hypothetical protein